MKECIIRKKTPPFEQQTRYLKRQNPSFKTTNALFEMKKCIIQKKSTPFEHYSKQKTLQLTSSFTLAWTCVTWCWRSGIERRRIVSPVWESQGDACPWCIGI